MLDITQIKDITELTFPQSLFDCQKIASAKHADLGSFSVYVGLSEKYANDIKKYSLDKSDTALQEATGDYERFGKSDYPERYKKKPRTQIILVHDESDEIASFIWFGPRNVPKDIEIIGDQEKGGALPVLAQQKGGWFTGSYRTYGIYRGVKITRTFSLYVLELYATLHPQTNMWLAVQMHNAPAIGLYQKLGFHTYGVDAKEKEYVMTMKF